MTVANILKELKGVYANDQAAPDADIQDTISDDIITIPMLLDTAAGTDFTYGSFKVPFAFQVVDVSVQPGAALTAADATANTYTLGKADGAGGASTVVASFTSATVGGSGSGNWVADVFVPATLSAVAGATLVARGQIVTWKKTHLSTGTVTPASTCTLKIRRV